MTKKWTIAAAHRAISSIAMWVLRAATLCTGILAMFALVVVLASLMTVMIVATVTPALAASAAHDPRKRFAHRPHFPPSAQTTCGGESFHTVNHRSGGFTD
jgi:hypothetical protein